MEAVVGATGTCAAGTCADGASTCAAGSGWGLLNRYPDRNLPWAEAKVLIVFGVYGERGNFPLRQKFSEPNF